MFGILVFAVGTAFAAEAPDIDWNRINRETLEHYSNLIRIDTSNPPGNETKAVDYLRRVLDREGISYQVFAKQPDRANLVCRIKGNGSKRPVIVMGHTDVVGVQRDKWTVDPFAAIRKDGYIYGRGATDDKDNLTASLMAVLLLKRMHVPLDRDVIFVAESGEEGNSETGIGYLVGEHWNDIAAEFALAEGGAGVARGGQVRYISVATAEKVPRGAKLIAHGTAGHGSRPRPDNAVIRLADAVAKVGAWEPPMRLSDTTRAYFERLATVSSPAEADRYLHIVDPGRQREIQNWFLHNEPANYSILRTSVVPTIMNIGFRSNVIPSQGEATLDIRALPDEDMDKFYDELRRVIGDKNVDLVPNSSARPASPPSRMDTAMFAALEGATKRMYGAAPVIPMMMTGATDMAQLRAKGVQAYGIGPVADEKDGGLGAAHTDDERLLEQSLYDFVRFQFEAVMEVGSSKR